MRGIRWLVWAGRRMKRIYGDKSGNTESNPHRAVLFRPPHRLRAAIFQYPKHLTEPRRQNLIAPRSLPPNTAYPRNLPIIPSLPFLSFLPVQQAQFPEPRLDCRFNIAIPRRLFIFFSHMANMPAQKTGARNP